MPGFHATVGGGGEKQPPEWYEEKGEDTKHSLIAGKHAEVREIQLSGHSVFNLCLWPAGIDYKTNTKITSVDVAAKKLTAESGDTINYEKLIVATGARVSDSASLSLASKQWM